MIYLIGGLVIWLIGWIGMALECQHIRRHKLYKAQRFAATDNIFWLSIFITAGAMLIGSTVGN